MSKNRGLYPKYRVQRLRIADDDNGQPVIKSEEVNDWVFVLNPVRDPGAVAALRAYIYWAYDNDYRQLAIDLEDKLEELGKADW